jgi:8-oxo-dGTP pyrophosphatase MutT (NUDIX family)
MKVREKNSGLPIQTGALPWRRGRGERVEVLLVTGRKSGRWLIPKGWPMFGKSLAAAAAQEALEEAGVEGVIDPEPLGSFRHGKQHLVSGPLEVSIVVHSLAVDNELPQWPESEQRRRKWFPLGQAAEQVDSKALSRLILNFRPSTRTVEREGRKR